jgi:membrane-associated phospholipid phosphatase
VLGTVVYVFLTFFKAGLFPKEAVTVRRPGVWRDVGILALVMLLCVAADPAVKTRVLAMKSASLDPVFRFFNMFGDGNFLYGLLVLFFLAGKLFGIRAMERLFGLALFSSILLGVLGQAVQLLTLRARPFVEEHGIAVSSFDFFNYAVVLKEHLLGSVRYRSFPSGHAITVFAAAMPFVFSLRRWWWKALVLALPVMTGLARVYFNKHWLSDVVMSAVLAAVVGWYLWKADQAGRTGTVSRIEAQSAGGKS